MSPISLGDGVCARCLQPAPKGLVVCDACKIAADAFNEAIRLMPQRSQAASGFEPGVLPAARPPQDNREALRRHIAAIDGRRPQDGHSELGFSTCPHPDCRAAANTPLYRQIVQALYETGELQVIERQELCERIVSAVIEREATPYIREQIQRLRKQNAELAAEATDRQTFYDVLAHEVVDLRHALAVAEAPARPPQAPELAEKVTTFTPLMWVSLSDDQKYEEYVRVRELLMRHEIVAPELLWKRVPSNAEINAMHIKDEIAERNRQNERDAAPPANTLPIEGCIHCRPDRVCTYHAAENNPEAPARPQPADPLIARIDNYIGNGGFFNPESMEHDKVRDLLMDIREKLTAEAAVVRPHPDYLASSGNTVPSGVPTSDLPSSVSATDPSVPNGEDSGNFKHQLGIAIEMLEDERTKVRQLTGQLAAAQASQPSEPRKTIKEEETP